VLQRVPGGVADFEPLIRFHTFADSSINLTTVLCVREFAAQFVVKHEFIKALAGAYAVEGIVIPFPIRALNLGQERVGQALPGP
jgi:small-conductance mechanosensitive channel